MTFLDQVRALASDASAPIVVYGAGEGSLDAATASEKLRAAGYAQVQAFDGGLADWRAAGLPLDGDGNLPQQPVPDGTFRLDTAQSVIRWTGRNLFNHHSGTVKLAAGEIILRQGQLASARFTVDMTSIANEDISDSAMNALLVAHLRSADFFDTEHHPTAQFTAAAAEKIATCTEGTPNFLLRGTFTLRGISRPLGLPSPSGDALRAACGRLCRSAPFPCSSPWMARASPARACSHSTAPNSAATTARANSSASSANTS
jgi:polyisoprenoid-binding protein YceI